MKTVTKTYEVYEYDELSEKSKEKVINDTIQFILEAGIESPNIIKAINMAKKMQTAWFTGSYIFDYAKDEVLEIARQYEYLQDGNIFSDSCQYEGFLK